MGNAQNKNKNSINTNTSLKNEMREYYSSILNKLQYVINRSKNKKIISITPKYNNIYTNDCDYEKTGITIKYDNGEIFNVSCDSIEADVIMWYFEIDGKKLINYVDKDFQKYIKKNVQKN